MKDLPKKIILFHKHSLRLHKVGNTIQSFYMQYVSVVSQDGTWNKRQETWYCILHI